MHNVDIKKKTVGATYKDYILLLRPKHWIKNSFLFIPLFFAGAFNLYNSESLYNVLLVAVGMLSFSLIASSIYIINDYNDIEADRLHPEKCNRPLASGKISKIEALIIFSFLMIAGLSIAYTLHPKFFFILSLYFVLNIGYSFGLKNISILDIIFVSIGFVLRVKAGGAISGIYVSEWLTIMVFLLSLLMALAKRRDDLLLKMDSGLDMRKTVKSYSMEFINACLAIVAAVTIVAYLMYTISDDVTTRLGTYRLYYTCIFVIAGIFRYLQITWVDNATGSPTNILYRDRFIQLSILSWILSFYFIIYYPKIIQPFLSYFI